MDAGSGSSFRPRFLRLAGHMDEVGDMMDHWVLHLVTDIYGTCRIPGATSTLKDGDSVFSNFRRGARRLHDTLQGITLAEALDSLLESVS